MWCPHVRLKGHTWRAASPIPYISIDFSSFIASHSLLSWVCYWIHHVTSYNTLGNQGGCCNSSCYVIHQDSWLMGHGHTLWHFLGRTPRIFSERSETLSACTRTSVPRRREGLKDIGVVCLLCFRMEALSNHSSSKRAQDVKKEKIDHGNVLQPMDSTKSSATI